MQMTAQTLKQYCTEAYLPTRIGMAKTSAQQLLIAARLFDARLRDLDERGLARRLVAYRALPRSPRTVNGKRQAILTLWDAAAEDGLCRPPVRKRVPRCKEYRRLPRAWTTLEMERLLAVARSMRGKIGTIPRRLFWPSIVLTIWDTGIRIGSLLSVRTEDVSLADRWMIARAEDDKSGVDRFFPLGNDSTAAIAGHFSPTRTYLWPWPWNRRQIWIHFRKLLIAASLSSDKSMGCFHQLRRTSLSYTAAGGGVALAQQQAGHASSATTVRHYLDPRIAQQRSAVDVLPELNVSGDRQMRLF